MPWFVVILGINTTSDISKLLYVISRAVRRVKFETILKYKISRVVLMPNITTYHAITYTYLLGFRGEEEITECSL